jgi:DNA polymerase III alpha subunit (gram-positive type)
MHLAEMKGQSLRNLGFIVFDKETNGLWLSKSDEIMSIASIRVDQGVID